MKICPQCPMHDERYIPTDEEQRRTIQRMRLHIESMADFIEWLFDHSEHCDHIHYSDAWEEYQQWQAKQDALTGSELNFKN